MINGSDPSRILVTGGAGFLGSHLCEELLAAGHQVFCLDNLFTGAEVNISSFSKNAKFQFINHDVETPVHLQVDQIFNLACPASPVHYQSDPIKTTTTCVFGALNMLELARANKASILQASTSEVYGDPNQHPQNEGYWGNVNPIGIRACYDEGKRCAETLFFDYHRTHDLDIKVARIFNTYGPRMNPNDGRVVSNFIMQALQGKNLTIYGDGQQTRSFCYVSDMIDGLVKLMNKGSGFSGPVNLGNPHEFTMLELAENILKFVGGKSKLEHLPLPSDDPKKRRPDISLAKRNIAWEPKVGLEEGLLLTINYFKSFV